MGISRKMLLGFGALSAVIPLVLAGCSSNDGAEGEGPSVGSQPMVDNQGGASGAVEEAAAPEAAVADDESAERAYTSFEATEVGVDWCVSQSSFDDRGGFGFYDIDASGTGYFSVDYETQIATRRSFADETVVEALSFDGFLGGYVGGSDWVWFSSGDRDGKGSLWREGEPRREVGVELANDRQVLAGLGSIADDGSAIAIGVWLNGLPFDHEPEPPLETRIVEVATNRVMAVFDGDADLLPDGDRVVVRDSTGWSVQRLSTGAVEAELEGPGEFEDGRTSLSPDRRLLMTTWTTYADGQDPFGESKTVIYGLDDLTESVGSFGASLQSTTPDGRFAFAFEGGGDADDDGDGLPNQIFSIRDTVSGNLVLGPFAKPYADLVGPRSSQQGIAAFSHDSEYAATWAVTDRGTGIHVVDLVVPEVVDVIPANSGAYLQFDPLDNTLYFSDRVTGQFGHVDLADGQVLIGEPIFSYQTYTGFLASGGIVVYPGPRGSTVRCELRAAADGLGDGSGPPLPAADPADALTEELVRGAQLPVGPLCQGATGSTVQLQNGEAATEQDGWNERFWIGDTGLAVDDLNGDDVADAVVILSCNLGGNTNFESLILWLAGEEPQVLSLDEATAGIQAGGGFLSEVAAVETSGNLVRIRWVGNQRDDPIRIPSVEMDSLHRVTGLGEFRFIRNEARNEASQIYEDLLFG